MSKIENHHSDDDELFDEEEVYGDINSPTPPGNGSTTIQHEEHPQTELIVEKVLGRRMLTLDDGNTEELFYIKWKGMSYLHASWEVRDDIEQVDPNGKIKLKRFMQTPQLPGILGEPRGSTTTAEQEDPDQEQEQEQEEITGDDGEIEYFSPDLVEVQRIISCNMPDCTHAKAKKPEDILNGTIVGNKRKARELEEDNEGEQVEQVEMTEEGATTVSTDAGLKYLVKWRGAPYSECTWESFEEIKSNYEDIYLFWQIQKPPTSTRRLAFPALQEYKKLESSPLFGLSNLFPIDEETQSNEGLRLRDYQLEGVNWLLWNWWHHRSCILADEMGLGKTIQTITFLHQLRYMSTTQVDGPFLIIAPLSLVDQWQGEVATWSPDMNCVLLHGNQDSRDLIYEHELYFKEPFISKTDASTLKKAQVYKFHILLTTYEMAVKEIGKLSKIPWKMLIIDEAHKLKNASSKLFTTLSTLPCDHCVLLTGTPLQNRTDELWALLNFADPRRFDSVEEFISKFGDLKNAKQVAKLHDMLRPYLLRRIKEDVEKSLPPKEETIVEVALTGVQKRFYRAIYEKNTGYLYKGLKASNQPSLMNVMMELRKCCNHPYLVKGVEERVMAELTEEEKEDEAIVMKKLVECSGKLVLLDKLLPRLFSQGHKVLIFSQMVRVLNLLEDFLKFRGYSFERLDGSSRSSDRKEAVDRFCKPSANRFIMLLSTKAGGLGLNLTVADTVIIFDSDWNPQNDLQAQARAHRIGQTRAVMIYRLLTRKTYEMEMFHQASMKLGLDRAVLAHARSEQGGEEAGSQKTDAATKFSMKEIDNLLKRGAYDVFREDDNDQNEFVEADIDSILQRRAHKVVYNENGGMANTLGSFSKASFVSADEKEDVDINDPDFWKKAIGLKENSAGELHDQEEIEILPMQRHRKQTKVYGDLHNENDLQFKKMLKPVKPAKPDKAEKLAIKAALKEAQLREKREREEAKKAKLLEEAKMKCDPKTWGSHGRDRVLRSLNMYGFGRWERIRQETGKDMMEIKDLELFCRAYVLKCGLCAGEQDMNKNDSQYVRDAILTAREIDNLAKSGEKKLDIPPSLTESKFLGKLRTGLARKSLNKLDALAKLIVLIREIVDKAYFAKYERDDSELTIDEKFNALTVKELEPFVPFGDVRPSWARSCPWWNLECDRHLLIGVFKHGFGRYDLIKEDGDLIFKDLLNEQRFAAQIKQEALEKTEADEVVVKKEVVEVEKADVKTEAMEIDDGALGADDQELLDRMEEQEPDADMDEDLAPENCKSGAQNTQPGHLPDPRHLNRIIVWLLTSELARMSKAEYVEHQKKERKPRESKKYLDIDSNISSSPNVPATAYMMTEEEAKLLACFREYVDIDSICMSFRPTIKGMKKCSFMLTIPSPPSPAPNPDSALGGDALEAEEVIVTEIDAVKLTSAFILFGAPLPQNFLDFVYQKVKGQIGGEVPQETNEEQPKKEISHFSWKTIKKYTGVIIKEEAIELFYRTIFLPFCGSIITHKNLSTGSQKYLIPNPLMTPNGHHLAAKGMSQLFVMRQQILYSIQYILCNSLKGLMDFLRGPQGRNVDNMPVWWCPWIHDLALLVGYLKHGYLATTPIFEDPQLPFNEKFLKAFIRKVFIVGTDNVPAVGRYDIRNNEEAEEFVRVALQQKPDQRDAEVRVVRIVEEMTKTFPNDNMFKVSISSQLYRSIIGVSYLSLEAAETYNVNGKVKGDSKSKGSTARPPAISLKTFLKTTKKRRKQYLASYHQELLLTNKFESFSDVIDVAALRAMELGTLLPESLSSEKASSSTAMDVCSPVVVASESSKSVEMHSPVEVSKVEST